LIEDPPAVPVSVGKKALSRPDRTADPGRHIWLVCYCIFAGWHFMVPFTLNAWQLE